MVHDLYIDKLNKPAANTATKKYVEPVNEPNGLVNCPTAHNKLLGWQRDQCCPVALGNRDAGQRAGLLSVYILHGHQ